MGSMLGSILSACKSKGRASEDAPPVVHMNFLADAHLFHQPSAVLLIFRSPFCILNAVLIEELLHEQSYTICAFSLSTIFHFIKHIAHIAWASFLAIGICIVRFLKPIIIRHNT